VFSPGNPASFQANYCAGQALLEQLEALAASRAAVERLRASTAAAGWAKRWNLPVYFSLVFQDIAGALLWLWFLGGMRLVGCGLSCACLPLLHTNPPLLCHLKCFV
jgi:hypothetical protein